MNVLVYSHGLHIGGSQIVAIELAAAVRDLGHRVLMAAPDGPLAELVDQRGLPLALLSPPSRARPSLRAIRFVRRLVRREAIDVVHAYAHGPCLEAYFGAHVLERTPLVGTMLALSEPRPYPKTIPMIVGTRALKESLSASRTGEVHLMEPPIDVEEDSPAVSAAEFRRAQGLQDTDLHIVIVSRLVSALKLEGLERSIDATEVLAEQLPVRLLVVGGGEAYESLLRRAQQANERLGRRAIILTGPMLDPRPAYAAADVVIGMGSSILRGMAFAKPAVVVGQGGFSEIVMPSTVDRFLREGLYGVGDGDLSPHRLCHQLRDLLEDDTRRAALGRFGRELVCERFSLRAAAEKLDELYRDSVGMTPGSRTAFLEGIRLSRGVVGRYIRIGRRALDRYAHPGAAHARNSVTSGANGNGRRRAGGQRGG